MVLMAAVVWIATVMWSAPRAGRRPPDGLHDVYVMWIRYAVHVDAYLSLTANPYPGFLGTAGSYPVDAELPRAADVPDQGRWGVFFRVFLALPPLALAAALGGGSYAGGYRYSFGALGTIAFLSWFAILVRGSMPAGLQRTARYCVGYTAQATAYLFLVTPRYPNAHPRAVTE